MARPEIMLGVENGCWKGAGAVKRWGHEGRNRYGAVNAPFSAGYSDVQERHCHALQVLTGETGWEAMCMEAPGEAPVRGRWQREVAQRGGGGMLAQTLGEMAQ